ncbi:MAG: HNH endonuclease signature motif containing protein [Anaerovoracaceae bacterium]|jgi:hypothetical protein
MRNEKGQFVKGHRASPDTEFKKGEHWRDHKPYWDRAWLNAEYTDKRRSASEIAEEFGITDNAILYWLQKHGIATRDMATIREYRHWGVSGEQNGMYGCVGQDNPNWNGGCTPERQAFYSSQEWAKVCLAVWRRDNAQCVRCGKSAEDAVLHVHHIVSFAVEALRAEPDNLILLCARCHRWVHSKRNRKGEYRKEVENGGQNPPGGLS